MAAKHITIANVSVLYYQQSPIYVMRGKDIWLKNVTIANVGGTALTIVNATDSGIMDSEIFGTGVMRELLQLLPAMDLTPS